MVNSDTCTLYELWRARYSASGSTAGSGAIWSLASNQLRPAGWTSADAAGLPILPGLLEMQQYGLILDDNGSNWFFQGSTSPRWPGALISLLKQIPARAFQAVNESCLMVSPNSGQAQASPGCPIG